MNRATPRLRSIAKRLMDSEIPGTGRARAAVATMFPVTDKLRPHLEVLMGNGGVRALLARALVLASAEISWLRGARMNSDGELEGLEAVTRNVDPAEFFEGRVVLLAQLLGLLVAFIGPTLTSRLIGEVWPQIPLKERDFGKEDDRDEAK